MSPPFMSFTAQPYRLWTRFETQKKIFYTTIRPATRRRESDPARHPAEEENCSVIASSRVCRNAAAAYAPAMAT